jgi:peroxiredoxin
MQKKMWIGLVVATVAAAIAIPSFAVPKVGAAATNFTVRDADGQVVELAKYRGKTVVLEWNNPGCPFVQKHYNSSNMQKTQEAAVKDGVVWLTINSGAPGQQGHMNGTEAKAFVAKSNAKPTEYLLDTNGVVGKAYDAKTTPQMVIIDKAGKVTYQGAIDDKPTASVADLKTARNHVLAALSEMKAGKPVSVAETRPYGCSVKYAS